MVNGPVLAVIPARGGSKGIPRKNLRPLAGRPLLAHSIRAAQESGVISDIVVSTDCPEMAEVALALGAQVPGLRPAELATDQCRTLPVIQHTLHQMEALHGVTYEAVFTLEPTSPLRCPEDIRASLDLLRNFPCDSVVGLVELVHAHPIQIKQIKEGLVVPFSVEEPEGIRRQDLRPLAFIRSGAIYLTRRETLLAGSLYGARPAAYVMPPERSVSIDDELDFMFVECLYQRMHAAEAAP